MNKKVLFVINLLLILIGCHASKNNIDEFILVKGGSFTMGDTFGDGQKEERPAHEVILDSYYISKYEVTQKEYEDLMGNNPSFFGKGGKYPVNDVTWFDAIMYANKLSEKKGLTPYYTITEIEEYKNHISGAKVSIAGGNGYRLPTEAEWEYAARGGIKSEGFKYSGSNSIEEVAWYSSDNTNNAIIKQVGGKKPNELGIYDMNGNVSEWCWDWYGDYPSESQKNPINKSKGTYFNNSYKVFRGGSGYDKSSETTVIYRRATFAHNLYESLGFRLARSYSETSKGEYQQAEILESEEYSDGDILEEKYQIYVNDFKRILKTRDKVKLSELIRYPLNREYPVPDIKNNKDFIDRYDQIFDEVFINKILDSSTEKDWQFMGWRGINFTEGLVLMDENGYIKDINYSTKKEEIYKQALLNEYKNILPKSLQNFESPILSMETKQFLVKIDKMKDDSYRCCLWILGEDMSKNPDIIVENGIITYEGNGGDHFYTFKDNKCEYNIYVYYLRNNQDPPAMLETIDEDNTIRQEKAFVFNN